MRIIILISVMLTILVFSSSCLAVPPGLQLLMVDAKSGDQLWYYPQSVQVFDDYISVETYFEMKRPTQGGKYSLNTFYLKLPERKFKVANATLYDATEIKLIRQFGSQWFDVSSSLACEKLFAAVVKYIQSNDITPHATPAVAPPDLHYLPLSDQDDYYFYNPASLQVKDGCLSIQIVVEYYRPIRDSKYEVATVWLRPADNCYKSSSQKRYNEATEPVGTRPDDIFFRPIRQGSMQAALLAKVLDYCRDNNIQVQ